MELKFRLLEAREIESRVQQVTKNGCSVLLYKDARCDMNILDETVGPMNWKRGHARDNANCIVAIWDTDKKEWVTKEDTGTESNTEAEKGLASDSFKRACVNWGIGRELYTAPFIWISAEKCGLKDTGKKDKFGNPVYTTKEHFEVSEIGYNDHREINRLAVINSKTRETVYTYSDRSVPPHNPTTNSANADALKNLELILAAVKDASSANEAIVRIDKMGLFPEMVSKFKNAVAKKAMQVGCTYDKKTGFFVRSGS